MDWYNGGMEHTTLHLLYSRFWHKFLYDIGVVPTREPYAKRTSHGMILGEGGIKMSKSRGNVINPDDTVAEIGADAFRTYEMFMGAFDQPIPWSTQGARGCRKFLDRVWKLREKMTSEEEISAKLRSKVHSMIKKVSDDYEKMKFNTAIAAMMTFINDAYDVGEVSRGDMRALLQILNPVAPHMTEEIWQQEGLGDQPIYKTPWPTYDEAATIDAEVEIAVQVLGRIRARIMVPSGLDAAGTEEAARANAEVQKLLEGKNVVKTIAVPGRLINFIAK